MRRLAIAATLLVLVAACAADPPESTATSNAPVTVAFLRAVAGAPSTEPAFVAELRTAGFVKGRNLTILAADPDEAYPDPDKAAEVVRRWRDDGVDLIIALSSSGARIAADTAPDVDVLFLSNDPTATGLVDDEQAPEGHLTGASFRVPADRTLSLARRAVHGLDSIGLAYPPADPAAIANRDAVKLAAAKLGVTLVTSEFADAKGAVAAVDELAAQGIDALLLSTSPVATRALAETATAAAAHHLPVIANTTLAESALVSLSPDTEELGHQLGRQAARLLAGADPKTVPVENPNRFLVTLNSKVAVALGITLDADLLREANTVIE
jgi:putative ABC transport system substrate-binding protein